MTLPHKLNYCIVYRPTNSNEQVVQEPQETTYSEASFRTERKLFPVMMGALRDSLPVGETKVETMSQSQPIDMDESIFGSLSIQCASDADVNTRTESIREAAKQCLGALHHAAESYFSCRNRLLLLLDESAVVVSDAEKQIALNKLDARFTKQTLALKQKATMILERYNQELDKKPKRK